MRKKFILKILLIVAALFLLFASYCGYHMCRMLSLDPGFNLSGDNFGDPESALNMLLGSKDLSGGIACGTLPSHLRADYMEPRDYLKTGFSAEYFFQIYDINEKRLKSEITQRYEKDSLEGELRSKWGKGTIITQYVKEDSCYRVSKEIKAESADSVVVVDLDKPLGTSHLHVGKLKNGKVTECIVCRLNDDRCDSVVYESRIEFDPVSGKLLSSFDKTRNAYFEGSLYETKNIYSNKESFDSLGRLVELNMDGRIFRYEYSSSDTANYSVKILNKSGIKVGFYKRKFKGNRETVQYGTDRHEEEINRYFENGKMVKETSKTFDFYRSVMFRVKMFNANGDIVRDSSFYEDAYFPGLRTDSYADVIKWEYGENGKPQKYVQFEERFIRPLPFVFFPLLSESRNEIVRYVFAYDDAGQLISITDESEDEIQKVRNTYPYGLHRVVYSKGKLEKIKECKEPENPQE